MKYLDYATAQKLVQKAVTEGAFANPRQALDSLVKRGYSIEKWNNEPKAAVANGTIFRRNPAETTQALLGQDLAERGKAIGKEFVAGVTGQRSPSSGLLPIAGQVAGGVMDVIEGAGRAAYRALPDVWEQAINEKANSVAKKFFSTPAGKKAQEAIEGGASKYAEWSKKNPELAADVEGMVNIGALLPVGKTAEMAGTATIKQTGRVAGRVATKLEEKAATQTATTQDTFLRGLVRPVQTTKARLEEVGRTTETGKGIFRKTTVNPSVSEQLAIDELKNIPTVKSTNSAQQNFNAVREALGTEAQNLESQLAKSNFIFPKQTLKSKLLANKTALVAENPIIVGDAEKVADKLINKFMQFVDENPANATGLLKARKDYDAWVKSTIGETKAFDPKTSNAYEVTNRMVRNTVNDFLDTKATDVGVKQSLKKQRSLYTALDTLRDKAAKESDTVWGRLMDWSGKVLGEKNRAFQILGTTAGIGVLGASAAFAPATATLGGIGLAGYMAAKAISNPKLKSAIASWLRAIEKKALQMGDKQVISDIANLRSTLEMDGVMTTKKR